MTGPEFRQLRIDLGEAIGRTITAADMAKLCGLPQAGGSETIHRWRSRGRPGRWSSGCASSAMASARYPILDKFNVFDRHDVDEKERPARRAEFRDKLREEVRERLD